MKRNIAFLFLLLSLTSFGQTISTKDTVQLRDVSVTGSYTATKQTPFTVQNLNSKDISLRTMGTEPAVLLSYTPSITFYSDNGVGAGYMYYRLRGIDQTRINSTLNGIPLNEPEDQGVYYNNYGGFLGSISNIQLIRGAGLSKPGVSSYGGSINFSSLEFADKLAGFGNVVAGSYNTRQLNAGINTPHFFLIFSKLYTDGYRDRSSNSSNSVFYGGKINKGKNEFKLYGFVGQQENGMAWMGEPLDSIKMNPKFNSNTDKETDNFIQVHNQLSWQRGLIKATVYHNYLKGWYTTDMNHFDDSHTPGDLINKIALRSNWLGTNVNFRPQIGPLYTNIGFNAFTYYRDHAGSYNKYSSAEPWYYSYNNTGKRNEVSPYAKAEIKFKGASVYGDVQYRYTTFAYDGLASFETLKWGFLNWSAGFSAKTSTNSSLYYGIGLTHREPTRSDLFLGYDDLDLSLYTPILPEQALNNELGWKYKNEGLSINANVYYMAFKNEIVLNGKTGPNSLPLHQNAAKSFRSGFEIDARYIASRHWEFLTSNSLSFNRIKQDGFTFQPVLTPSLLISGDVVFNLSRDVYTGLNFKHSGNAYIDFSNEHTLPAYSILGIYAGVHYKNFFLRGAVNNLADKLIFASAVMGDEPRYFVMAGRNYSLSFTFKF